jgi:membrane protein YdbS with pleckstrin-like domain
MENCSTCGERLAGAARFCAACGAAVDSEETRYAGGTMRASEETRVATRQADVLLPQPVRPLTPEPLARRDARDTTDDLEQVIFRVRPTLMFVKLGYAVAAVGGILLIALLTWAGAWGLNIPLYISIPLALALLLIPAFYHVKRNMLQYTLTDSKIEIDEGLISQTTRNIPLRNIQDVTVRTSVLQRLLKFGNLVVDNASEEGGVTILRDIPDPRRHADLLLRELRRWR